MRISSELLSRLSSAVLRLYTPAAPTELPAKFFSVVRDLISCEHLSYNEFGEKQVTCLLDPVIDPAISEAWVALVDQHPVINHITETNTSSAFKISDFVSDQQWRRTELFNEVFAKLQVERQLGFMFSVGNTKVGFAANRRHRDFSEIHRFILSFLASHLSLAIQNAAAMARLNERMYHVADLPSGGGVIVFNDEGIVLFCSKKAADCVGRFFGPVKADKLPDELYRWVKRGIRKPTIDDMSEGALHPFAKEDGPSSLTVRLMPNHATKEHTLVLEEQLINLQYLALKQYGLTSRETEVLQWVTQGKTNPEIAIILDISVKTVGHHIEHIMSKLGVERRGAAALWAQQTMALRM